MLLGLPLTEDATSDQCSILQDGFQEEALHYGEGHMGEYRRRLWGPRCRLFQCVVSAEVPSPSLSKGAISRKIGLMSPAVCNPCTWAFNYEKPSFFSPEDRTCQAAIP